MPCTVSTRTNVQPVESLIEAAFAVELENTEGGLSAGLAAAVAVGSVHMKFNELLMGQFAILDT